LHDVYVIAGVLAALTLALVPLLPAGASLTRSGASGPGGAEESRL
jgi:hypothetical protein